MTEGHKAVFELRDTVRELVQYRIPPNEMEAGITRTMCIGMLEAHVVATGAPRWRGFPGRTVADVVTAVRTDMGQREAPPSESELLLVLRRYGVVLVPTFSKVGYGIPVRVWPGGGSRYRWLGVNAYKVGTPCAAWLAYGLGLCIAQDRDCEPPLFAADFAHQLLGMSSDVEVLARPPGLSAGPVGPKTVWDALRGMHSPALDALISWHRQRGTGAPKLTSALFELPHTTAERFSAALLTMDGAQGLDLDADFSTCCLSV